MDIELADFATLLLSASLSTWPFLALVIGTWMIITANNSGGRRRQAYGVIGTVLAGVALGYLAPGFLP